jgi:hypothetical protein
MSGLFQGDIIEFDCFGDRWAGEIVAYQGTTHVIVDVYMKNGEPSDHQKGEWVLNIEYLNTDGHVSERILDAL